LSEYRRFLCTSKKARSSGETHRAYSAIAQTSRPAILVLLRNILLQVIRNYITSTIILLLAIVNMLQTVQLSTDAVGTLSCKPGNFRKSLVK
jgi:hypothetical protein